MVAQQHAVEDLTAVARDAPAAAVEAAARVLAVAGGADHARAAFVARSLDAIAHLARVGEVGRLAEAAREGSDYGVLVRALTQAAALELVGQGDPLVAARLRGLQAREQLLTAEGGTVSSSTAASLLGITRQGVDKRRQVGSLIGIARGRRGYAYPVWQFVDGGTLPGLKAVLTDLRDQDAWARLVFFLRPNVWLDNRTPLTALRTGDLDAVRAAARTYGEQVAA